MGQYTEGQRLQGSDGNVYVVQNGVPVRAGGGLASPKAPYEAPQAAATLQRTQQEVQQANATAAANTRMTNAQADTAEANAVIARQKAEDAKVQAALSSMGPNSQVHGEAYLRQFVPPEKWAIVRAYARGDLGSRAGGMSSSMLPIIQDAMNYDPTASGANFPARVRMQTQLANGDPSSIGGGMRSMEQMLLHGADVLKKSQDLDNFHSGLTAPLNYPRTAVMGMENSPALSAFNQAVTNYAPESQKAIAGVAGGEQERQARAKGYSANMSPEAVAAALQSDAGMAFQRMGAINDQYRRVMGRDITDALSPEAKAAYDAIMAGGYDKNGKPLRPAAGWTPISGGTTPTAGGNPVISNGPPPTLAGGGDSTKSLPIPQAMQDAHAQYLAQHWGHIDPNDYANFRAEQDKKYGFAPRLDAYRAIVPDLNKRAQQGGSPNGLNIPPVDAKMNGLDRFNASVFNNPAGAALLGAGSLAGGMDEVAGTLKAQFTGRPVSEEIARANAIRQASASQHPWATPLGNIGGTLALAAATGGAGLMADSPILTGIGYGAVNGALENNDNRIGGAIGGGILGGAGGAAGKYLAAPLAKAAMGTRAGQAVSNAVRPVANRVLGMFGSRAPQIAAVSDAVNLQPWEKTLPGADALTGARTNLQDAAGLNLPYSLADASPKLRMLAGSVARKSPNARDLAETTFDPRALGQADRAVNAIDTHLAPITNIEQRGSDLLAAGDQAAGPSYNLAFDRPGPVDPQIAAMLDTPAGKASLAHAQTIAANKGLDPNKLGFDLNDQGEVVLKSVPSFETLQLVKRGMDAHLNSFADQFGNLNLRGNPLAQSVLDLKSRFNGKLGELNPNYAEGNNIWSQFAQRKDALDQGYNVLPKNNVPRAQFEAGVSGLNDQTLPEAQMGYATNMADTANKARLTADPYNSIYGSPLQQQKVGTLFPQGAPAFDRTYNLERDMAKTRTETLGGSPTASRTAADQIFDNPLAQGLDVAAAVHTGGFSPLTALKVGSRALGDSWKLGVSQKKADALAPILYNTNPDQVLSYLDNLYARKAADEARTQAFRRSYGMFGSLAAPSAIPPN